LKKVFPKLEKKEDYRRRLYVLMRAYVKEFVQPTWGFLHADMGITLSDDHPGNVMITTTGEIKRIDLVFVRNLGDDKNNLIKKRNNFGFDSPNLKFNFQTAVPGLLSRVLRTYRQELTSVVRKKLVGLASLAPMWA
jgi:hypothetical protein